MNGQTSLDTIGRLRGTDKSSLHHGYLDFYEPFFAPIRSRQLRILEIGVFQGASLRLWEDFFPEAEIVGADINPIARQHQGGRITIEVLDQSNVEELVAAAVKHGPFDIVIDDGSHLWEHQLTSLRTLFPFVRPGGFYVVEDLQTNYGELAPRFRGLASQSCAEFLKSWLDLHIAAEQAPLGDIEDSFLRTYARGVQIFAFGNRVCLIQKRGQKPRSEIDWAQPLAARAGANLDVGVLAHISHVGDVYGPNGIVNFGADANSLQGLALTGPDGALEYRVRWPDGSWSDWARQGFLGTRGRALLLTGVAVRLTEEARPCFELKLAARFAGSAEAVAAASGEDCIGDASAALCALQIDLAPLAAANIEAPDALPNINDATV